jgi:hypothetical protein
MDQTLCRFASYVTQDRLRLIIHDKRNSAISKARYDIGRGCCRIKPLEDLMNMIRLDFTLFQLVDTGNKSFDDPEYRLVKDLQLMG